MYMKKIAVFFFLVLTINIVPTDEIRAEACVEASDVITETSANNSCESEPTGYGITLYKLSLCSVSPQAPTTAASIGLSECVTSFENSSGSNATLSTGGAVNLDGGVMTRPATGTYTHGIVHMNNTFAITAKKEFEVAYNGQVSGRGVYCATVDGAGISSSTYASIDRTICGDTTITAGTYTESLTSFDEPFLAVGTANNIAGTGANITAYLVDSNEFLSTNDDDVDTLIGVVEFATPVNITQETTNIDISFNVGAGMSVDGSGGTVFFGSGPFQLTISTE
jgi:hypothetical protein